MEKKSYDGCEGVTTKTTKAWTKAGNFAHPYRPNIIQLCPWWLEEQQTKYGLDLPEQKSFVTGLDYQKAVLPDYKWPQSYPPGTGDKKFDVEKAMKLRTHGEEKSVLVSMEEASRLIKTITHEVGNPQRPPTLLFFFLVETSGLYAQKHS